MTKNIKNVWKLGSWLVVLFSLFLTISAQANNPLNSSLDKKITGKVTDESGSPLASVSVSIKGTTKGATTDQKGTFTLSVPNDRTVLVVSSVGYETQEFRVGTATEIGVTLKAATSRLDEVVVVGYASQKKVTLTGAVAVVKGSELAKSPATNLTNSIAGRLPGVVAVNGSGEPGYDGSAIRIRGSNTLGNNDALIVIDGVPARAGGIDRLSPNDIESMSVLKDASAAIYGARAANGVILITTKRGKTGKPELSYSHNQGYASPTVLPKMLNAVQYTEMANEIELYKLPPAEWAAASAAFKSTGIYEAVSGNTITAPFSSC